MNAISGMLVAATAALWWASGAHAAPEPADAPSDRPSFTAPEVDSGRVQPLDLRPGCWEVWQRGSITNGGLTKAQLDAARAQMEAGMGKTREALENEPRISREQREGMLAGQKKIAEYTLRTLGTPMTSGSEQPLVIVCTATPFIGEGKNFYGTPKPGCHRSMTTLGGVEHLHIACPGRTADYERAGAESFKTATKTWQALADDSTRENAIRSEVVAKWVGDATSH